MPDTYNVENWSSNHPYSSRERMQTAKVVTQTVDFSKYLSSSAATVGAASTDTVEVMTIEAGWFVLGVRTKVLTAEGGTLTVDIGDSSDANGYGDDVNLNTTTDSFSFNATTTPAYGVGKYYSTADTLELLMNNTADTAVVQLELVYFDLNVT